MDSIMEDVISEKTAKDAKDAKEHKLHMNIKENPKLCINCRHCVKINLLFTREYFCIRTVVTNVNLVTGKRQVIKKETCEAERLGSCGITGKHFEEREVAHKRICEKIKEDRDKFIHERYKH